MDEGALLDRGRSPASESLLQCEGSSLEHQTRREAVLARQRLEQSTVEAMIVPFGRRESVYALAHTSIGSECSVHARGVLEFAAG